jgi:hypothetical protein
MGSNPSFTEKSSQKIAVLTRNNGNIQNGNILTSKTPIVNQLGVAFKKGVVPPFLL